MTVSFVVRTCGREGEPYPKVGDTLYAINGNAVAEMSDEEVLLSLSGSPGSSIEVTVQDGETFQLPRCQHANTKGRPEADVKKDLRRQLSEQRDAGLISEQVYEQAMAWLEGTDALTDPASIPRAFAPPPPEP